MEGWRGVSEGVMEEGSVREGCEEGGEGDDGDGGEEGVGGQEGGRSHGS